jgi:hypothetical protein
VAIIPVSKLSGKKVATKKTTAKQTKRCMSCPSDKAEQTIENFYRSRSTMHADGRVPMCIECIKKTSYNAEKDEIDIDKFKDVLRTIDKPWIDSVFESSVVQYNKMYGDKFTTKGERTKIIGFYFKNIQTLRQYSLLNWVQGVEVNQKQQSIIENGVATSFQEKYEPNNINDERYYLEGLESFKVTDEMVNLFGSGYKKSDYKAMWDKYNFLKKSYPDVTNLHTEALVTYVRFKVKEEQAVAAGNASDADKWATAARNAADKAKINPSQLSQSDLQGGLNSFSELLMAVEQAVDVIPILPKFKFRPNDAIDFNIWCMINYLRDLEGKPLCSYEDVYQFYDKRKAEYIEQYGDPYGVFTGDPTESNRNSVKKFITLPRDYEDGEQ